MTEPAQGVSRAAVAAWLRRQRESPRTLRDALVELDTVVPDAPALRLALEAIADADRQRFAVRLQSAWHRRFGWRMMRPLFAVVSLAALGFLMQDALPPILGFSLFAAGAAVFYAVLQVYAHVWTTRDEKSVAEAEARLRDALAAIEERLAPGGGTRSSRGS